MIYPKLVRSFVQSTAISVVIELEGIDEDGAPVEGVTYSGKCNYQDSAGRTVTKDKQEIRISGSAYFDGDIAESLAAISGGTVTVNGEERAIVRGMKARNPDGTVNYTRIDLI